jgi:hypothetical protein
MSPKAMSSSADLKAATSANAVIARGAAATSSSSIPTLGLMDARIGALRNFPFKPKVHLNYAETVLRIRDGLPKLKDFPAEIGGSGETLPE